MNTCLPHGVMFHHFVVDEDSNSLGAISPRRLENIINHYQNGGFDLLPAYEWYERATTNSLEEGQVCLTLDDALRCQCSLALPVLEKYSLTAFWFVYSSVFEGKGSRFEIYRYFYSKYFLSFADFHSLFIECVVSRKIIDNVDVVRQRFEESKHLSEYSFYSDIEREYRYYRDIILGREKFEDVMDHMIAAHGVTPTILADNLWLTNDDLVDLANNDHIIGLHSYSHPTDLGSLNIEEQLNEYKLNADHVRSVTGKPATTVAHPVNSYTGETLEILRSVGIKVGFRSNMRKQVYSSLEFPRKDCVDV